MSQITLIRVSFSKQANDANYGSETARCEFELTSLDGVVGDLGIPNARQALSDARAVVHDELAKSPNYSVRRAVVGAGEAEPIADTQGEEIPF
jgi:hypothetical protein